MLASAGWPLVQPIPIPDSVGKQPPTKMIEDGKLIDMPLKGQEIFKKMFEDASACSSSRSWRRRFRHRQFWNLCYLK